MEGTGKFMRHVKIRPGSEIDSKALMKLIRTRDPHIAVAQRKTDSVARAPRLAIGEV